MVCQDCCGILGRAVIVVCSLESLALGRVGNLVSLFVEVLCWTVVRAYLLLIGVGELDTIVLAVIVRLFGY